MGHILQMDQMAISMGKWWFTNGFRGTRTKLWDSPDFFLVTIRVMCSQYFPGFQRFYLFWVCYISNLAASRRLWWVSIAAPWSLEAWLCRGNLGAWIIECLPPSFIGGYWSIINNNKMQKGYQYHNFSWILPKRSFSGCSLRIVINHQPPRYLCHQHSELHIWRNWLVKNSLILNFFATSGKVHWQPSVQEGLGCSAAHQGWTVTPVMVHQNPMKISSKCRLGLPSIKWGQHLTQKR